MKKLKYIKSFELLSKDEDELFSAVTKNKNRKIKNLIDGGVNVDAVDNYNRTALHFAVSLPGNIDIVKDLIDAGVNLDSVNDWGATPLFVASQYSSLFDYVKLLIDAGANWNISCDGRYFLDMLTDVHHNYIVTHYNKMYKDFLIRKEANKYNL